MANASSIATSVDTSSTRSQNATTPNSAEKPLSTWGSSRHPQSLRSLPKFAEKQLGLLWRGFPDTACPSSLYGEWNLAPLGRFEVARQPRSADRGGLSCVHSHDALRHAMRLNSSLTITAFRVCCGQSVRCFSLCGAVGRCRFVRDDRSRASTDCAEPQPAGQESQLPRRPCRPRTTAPPPRYSTRSRNGRQRPTLSIGDHDAFRHDAPGLSDKHLLGVVLGGDSWLA